MGDVTPFPIRDAQPAPQPDGTVAATFSAALAFEQMVGGFVAYYLALGVLIEEPTPVERLRFRQAVAQLVNEFDPMVRAAAEARCTDTLYTLLPATVAKHSLAVLVRHALGDYRHGLQQVPVRGVGQRS